MRSTIALSLILALGVHSRALGWHARAITERDLASNATYDFVIAGGGTAGLTVADRLSETLNVSVLVIEFGPFDQREDEVMIPGLFPAIPYFWLPLMSTPQTALGGTSYTVPCGRVVGGGSMVNAMFMSRGSAVEYDTWAQLGATGWTWRDLLPYFRKSETFNRPDPIYAAEHNITWDDSVHGFQGPVPVTIAPYDYPGSANFYNGARSLGIRAPKDSQAGDATGIYRLQRAVDAKTQARSSARVNHYDRVIDTRPNYHVLPSTAVSKVVFQGTSAVGVEYINTASGVKGTVHASKEAIIAAGAVHTPQILQLSGVGDASYLSKFGIESVADLPGVGQNLQDHLVLSVGYNFTSNLFPNGGSLRTNSTYAAEQRALYNAQQPSAYDLSTSTGNLFIQLPLSNLTNASASIISLAETRDPAELLGGNPDPGVLQGYKKQRKLIISSLNASGVGDISWNTDFATSLYMVKPLSRGSVRINSTDVLTAPLIDFGAITDPTDLEMLLAVYLKNRELMATPDIAILSPVETSPAPGLTDKDAIKDAIKKTLTPTNAHHCCTAAMMKREDGGVVDPQSRVYGTKRLSVVDISAWPLIVAGGPMGSVYAAAEKAADTIKARHGLL
ncbi:GMC oxidoreductase [Trematosphaeria pertusa]|uniref:GMC oxidoreductase n=1 Tax=Trematosphaeria pertusa TaxID=390896 RepID=A0A6A6I979_9PLEO|nr:GMC oxidoreductase [Trematosphaeria pertusa]KAF2246817.1 GMC oxidoreductase [Trematosphaeria pertusa]